MFEENFENEDKELRKLGKDELWVGDVRIEQVDFDKLEGFNWDERKNSDKIKFSTVNGRQNLCFNFKEMLNEADSRLSLYDFIIGRLEDTLLKNKIEVGGWSNSMITGITIHRKVNFSLKETFYFLKIIEYLQSVSYLQKDNENKYFVENEEIKLTFDLERYLYVSKLTISLTLKSYDVVIKYCENEVHLFCHLRLGSLSRAFNFQVEKVLEPIKQLELSPDWCEKIESLVELNSKVKVSKDTMKGLIMLSPSFREYSIDEFYKTYMEISLNSFPDALSSILESLEASKDEIKFGLRLIKHQSKLNKILTERLLYKKIIEGPSLSVSDYEG
ncbi:hypothetical protein [Leptospira santarosai]|uniref:Uncharacterized protein n=1 Tax=Leptospira santarosai serovar Shermani str. LT 821 TaxID=758847 RepID=K8XWM4_9LEPT|nr:hypothetical protein [Leptospira santarosai]EKT85306.1 hypothetical protein LSS_18294 [Leptospira santarosai serovar Shermani str. LT 821]EPG83385.1 hypothetical protein LEP1GSC048_1060 [Leptospira santarosai serovar Shermani str. 1342KT]